MSEFGNSTTLGGEGGKDGHELSDVPLRRAERLSSTASASGPSCQPLWARDIDPARPPSGVNVVARAEGAGAAPSRARHRPCHPSQGRVMTKHTAAGTRAFLAAPYSRGPRSARERHLPYSLLCTQSCSSTKPLPERNLNFTSFKTWAVQERRCGASW